MRYPEHIQIALIAPPCKPAAVRSNVHCLQTAFVQAAQAGSDLVVTPELGLTGYSAGDLFTQTLLLQEAENGLLALLETTRLHPWVTLVVGLPLLVDQALYNVAAVLQNGRLLGAVPKSHLPNHHEFYEKRWFRSGLLPEPIPFHLGDQSSLLGQQVFTIPLAHPSAPECWAYPPRNGSSSFTLGVEVCEDLWVPAPPSTEAALNGAEILVNLSASPALTGKAQYRKELVLQQSARLHAAYAYVSAGPWESSTDLVFSGHCMLAMNGKTLCESEGLNQDPLVSADPSNPLPMQTALVSLQDLRMDRLLNDGFSNQMKRSLPHITAPVPLLSQKAVSGSGEVTGTGGTPVSEGSTAQSWVAECPNHPIPYPRPNPLPFLPEPSEWTQRCTEILQIQSVALARRLAQIQSKRVVLGISGGLDSTLALLVAVRAFEHLNLDPQGILCVTMPGFGTTDRTYQNACALVQTVGGELREISIRESVLRHFADIGHNPELHDITYENAQARERTQILMDLANQEQALVVGTGDLSELALGWCTYNGDHMSMYAVNASVPKTLVSHLVRTVAEEGRAQGDDQGKKLYEILTSILETPISPELLPPDAEGSIVQITEDSTGPYILHDFFLYHSLRWGRDPESLFFLACQAFGPHPDDRAETKTHFTVPVWSPQTILYWLRRFYQRFFSQQYKRSCMPDGPKLGSVSLSPRGDWRMPSDASAEDWVAAVDQIQKRLQLPNEP